MLARPDEETPDAELVARCRAGDAEAFGKVYARYERQVFRHAYYILGNRDDADDAKQETFLKAYRAIGGFRSDCSVLTWLLKICGNLCRDRIKARRRHGEVLYDPNIAQESFGSEERETDPYEIVERKESTQALLGILHGLPQRHRDILLLHEMDELSCKEIAEMLGCSQASVKLRLFRARRQFKERAESLLRARES